MASPKHGAALEMVFGMGEPKSGADEGAHDEARDMLISAFHDVGIKDEEASNLVDALHEYVEACIEQHGAAGEEEEEPQSEKGY